MSRCKMVLVGILAVFLLSVTDAFMSALYAGRYTSPKFVFFVLRNLICVGLLLVAPYFLLGRRAGWFYVVVFPFLYVFEAIQCALYLKFKMFIQGDWLFFLTTSSLDEIRLFCKDFFNIADVFCFLLFVGGLIGCIVLCRRFSWRKTEKMHVWIGSLICIPFLLVILFGERSAAFGFMTFRPFGVTYSTLCFFRNYVNYYKAFAEEKQPELFQLCSNSNSTPTVIVIIGESATRNNWGLYGYSRNTTPCMEKFKNEIVLFSDLITCQPGTAKAVSTILTDEIMEHPNGVQHSLVQVCKAMGYACYLISNQYSFGNKHDILWQVFNGSKRIYLRELFPPPAKNYDEKLVPQLARVLETGASPKLILLHFLGSHYPPEEFYPPERGIYSTNTGNVAQDKLNKYDNSIHYTDWVLGEIMTLLCNQKKPVVLFYLSDHGESPRASGWRVFSDVNVWEVPAFAWFSEEYKRTFPEVVERVKQASILPLVSDQLFYGFLELCRIQSNREDLNFLDETFVIRKKRMYYNREYRKSDQLKRDIDCKKEM